MNDAATLLQGFSGRIFYWEMSGLNATRVLIITYYRLLRTEGTEQVVTLTRAVAKRGKDACATCTAKFSRGSIKASLIMVICFISMLMIESHNAPLNSENQQAQWRPHFLRP